MPVLLSIDFLPYVPSGSGWIERNGAVYRDIDVYGVYVGDSDQNKQIRAFVSFDLPPKNWTKDWGNVTQC